MQVVRYGPISVGVKIFQTEVVGALFSGISATVLRHTLYSTTRMGMYEIFKEKWTDARVRLLNIGDEKP
ncbi:hypothetical protein CTI12_AA175000 [Artemisia annua]|uniref:Uncharacterized protein n=1 Tax=Artemisia annua TaxID=35608 RepID=A0A2U1PAN6_ARTAN|nr:hypothetical protein CTI12_AA175000 [Artemisia annua]